MAITDKTTGVWGLDQVYNKINQGSIWTYPKSLWTWGWNSKGQLGQNNETNYSSPVQIGTETTWAYVTGGSHGVSEVAMGVKTDGTLWAWGENGNGALGQNDKTHRSSPVQVGSDTTWNSGSYQKLTMGSTSGGIKTDGTLWMWGKNEFGNLGQNNTTQRSSPIQIPGTTWASINHGSTGSSAGVKTDGTLWMWGHNSWGNLGQNNRTNYSSPIQVPGTNWDYVVSSRNNQYSTVGRKTDGTLWSWGYQLKGSLGLNQGGPSYHSSPTQIPGTTWKQHDLTLRNTAAVKTDGTLWIWGTNLEGQLGQNQANAQLSDISSPVQIPGTTWDKVHVGCKSGSSGTFIHATKTDNTLWAWGHNQEGQLGQNNTTFYSSPVQIPGTRWAVYPRGGFVLSTKE